MRSKHPSFGGDLFSAQKGEHSKAKPNLVSTGQSVAEIRPCGQTAANRSIRLLQRVVLALVKRADVLMAEAFLVDLDIGAEQLRLRQLLDGKANGLGGAVEAAVLDLGGDLAIARRKQLRGRCVIKFTHHGSNIVAESGWMNTACI